jgi:hypothetical protein
MVEPKTGATRPVNHKYTVTAETNDRGYVGFNAEFAASDDDGRVDVIDLGGRWDSVVSAKRHCHEHYHQSPSGCRFTTRIRCLIMNRPPGFSATAAANATRAGSSVRQMASVS